MKVVENFHIVPVGPDGYPAPDLASPPVKVQAGDIYLTQSSERTSYQEWIRAGDEWVQVGETLSPDDEVDRLKKERVNSVREYFRKKEYQYRQRKTCETSKEISGFLDKLKVDPELYPVVQKMLENLK
jgi:hypothetical protein